MMGLADLAVLIGRILIAALFVGGAIQKAVDPEPAMQLLSGFNLPTALVWVALGFDAIAGAMVAVGWAVRPVAVLLAAYCAVTRIFHLIPEDPWQMSIFVKNWAIAGGCLVLAAHGPGRYVLGKTHGGQRV
ncbi:DoxX family protein [Marivita sp.]|uniref:DoxX family protein n=1 Tax=Marivita sp. TaxID=2003365 RepID=UPI00262ADB0A|nr:DoxX family protein [Marivita sp.]